MSISRTVSVYLDEDTNNRLIKAKDRSGRSKTISRAGGKKSAGQTSAVHLSEPAHAG